MIENINAARERIVPYILHTPLIHSPCFSKTYDCNVYFKCEHLQHSGSFKLRGALNKVLQLSKEQKRAGVVTASTGNHGQGVAKAGSMLNVSVTVYMPSNAAKEKVSKVRDYGADICFIDGDCFVAENIARAVSEKEGKEYISPYNDTDVIAGQGTIGLEILESDIACDAVFMSVGGGGLISGVGTALKHSSMEPKVIGCWAEHARAMYDSLHADKIVKPSEFNTISDGTAGGVEAGSITFDICKRVIDDKLLVSEKEIVLAMRTLAEKENIIVEGAAGVAISGFVKEAQRYKGKTVVIILCGKNIEYRRFLLLTGQ